MEMEYVYLVLAMIGVGGIVGALAGAIWKDDRPIGVVGDYLVAIGVAIVVGILDWIVIPAMDFSDTWKYIGVAVEPPLGALLALWIVRKAKQ
jgi:uncharacterized membrane protein YeaQ/YmgE (transglycosylase-associated protein family)